MFYIIHRYYRKELKLQLRLLCMARERGDKLPTNFVKLAILLYLTDTSKSTSEIREFLKELVGITERRNIQKHLSELYDDKVITKVVKQGIGSYYQWNNDISSFKKIINWISNNSEAVKEIQDNRMKKVGSYDKVTQYHLDTLTTPIKRPFDPTRFWYHTNYAVSFFNEKTISTLIDHTYKKYLSKKPTKPFDLEQFEIIVLEGIDRESLVVLMHYSPNLVRYLLNLDIHYVEKLSNLKIREDLIKHIVLNDALFGHFPDHSGAIIFGNGFNLSKEYDNKQKLQSIKLELYCNFPKPKPRIIDHGVQLKL